jgi:thiol-disulfide isomerase/thioredoxin
LATGALVIVGIAAALFYYVEPDLVASRAARQATGPATLPSNPAPPASDTYKFSFFDQPRRVPPLHFVAGDNRSLSLEDFRGRPILLNIWATWCVPCRKEMPALDRLQASFAKSELLVLPLSIDRQGATVVKPFYHELGLTALGTYIDQSGEAASELGAVGVPTTLLIDREGREIGRKVGPAEWDSAAIIALLRAHLGLPSSAPERAG